MPKIKQSTRKKSVSAADPIEKQLCFNQEKDANKNNCNVQSENNIDCPVCKQRFISEDEKQFHVQSAKLKYKQYECCNCKKIFKNSWTLKIHYRIRTGKKPFSCTICEKKFTISSNVSKHMRTHTDDAELREKKFECDHCGKKFSQLVHLKDHASVHTDERDFICIHCEAGYKSKFSLINHFKKYHNDENGIPKKWKRKNIYTRKSDKLNFEALECFECRLNLRCRANFNVHFATHVENKEATYKCKVCGRKSADYAAYEQHAFNHSKQKYLNCKQCGKSYSRESDFKRHEISHLAIKPFICNLCGKSFCLKDYLNRHLTIHSEEKRFSCPICQKRFLSSENMDRHFKVHTGERSFKCRICDNSFAHKSTLADHMAAIHCKLKRFKCIECGHAFALKQGVNKHVKRIHPFLSIKQPNQQAEYIKIESQIEDVDELRNVKFEPELKTEEITIFEEKIEVNRCFVKEEKDYNGINT